MTVAMEMVTRTAMVLETAKIALAIPLLMVWVPTWDPAMRWTTVLALAQTATWVPTLALVTVSVVALAIWKTNLAAVWVRIRIRTQLLVVALALATGPNLATNLPLAMDMIVFRVPTWVPATESTAVQVMNLQRTPSPALALALILILTTVVGIIVMATNLKMELAFNPTIQDLITRVP